MVQVWTKIGELLQAAHVENELQTVVLTDTDGLVIASVTRHGTHSDATAALAAFARRTALRVEDTIGMKQIEESHFRNSAGQRLVCRLFKAGEQNLILVVLVEAKRPYRRVTNRLIKQIQQLWQTI